MRAEADLQDRLEYILKMIVPYGALFFLFVLSLISAPYPLDIVLKSPILLMAVYYWSLYRPTLLPPFLVFAAGLAFDLISGTPYVGLTALLLLLCRFAIVDQRRFLMAQGFMIVWLAFICIDMIYFAAQWLIFSIFETRLMPIENFMPSFILGLILFPLIYFILFLTHKILPAPPASGQLSSKKPSVSL